MRLSVPYHFHDIARTLFATSDTTQQALLDAYSSAEPSVILDEWVDRLASRTQALPHGELEAVSQFLLSLFPLLSSGREYSQVVDDVSEAVQGLMRSAGADVDEATAERFHSFIGQALKLNDTVGFVAKAVNLSSSFDRLLTAADIISDSRWVFSGAENLSPDSAMIVHTLKISAYNGREVEDIYVTLDSRDLSQLRETVDRALVKHGRIAKAMASAGVRVIDLATEG